MGTAIYILEDNTHSGFTSIPRSIYWAIVTVTTVGYGDIAPQTVPGQALASMMMVCGYSLLAVPTGLAAAEYHAEYARGGSAPRRRRPVRPNGAARSSSAGSLVSAVGAGKRGCQVVPTRACDACEAVGHDADASYCKHCGEPLGD